MTTAPLPIDLYGWFETLTADEDRRRLAMRTVLERDITPVANDHWDRGEFYFDVLDGFHALDIGLADEKARCPVGDEDQ